MVPRLPFVHTHMSVWVDCLFLYCCCSCLCVFLAGKGLFKTSHWCGNSSWATFWLFWCLRYGLCCQYIRQSFDSASSARVGTLCSFLGGVINLVYCFILFFFTLISKIGISVFVIFRVVVLDVFIINHSFDLVIKWLKIWIRILFFVSVQGQPKLLSFQYCHGHKKAIWIHIFSHLITRSKEWLMINTSRTTTMKITKT